MSCNTINKTLIEIESKLGLKLKLYDGILKTFNGKKYFDVELKYSCWMSNEYQKLISYCNKYDTFKTEQTGYKRVGIFINNRNYDNDPNY